MQNLYSKINFYHYWIHVVNIIIPIKSQLFAKFEGRRLRQRN